MKFLRAQITPPEFDIGLSVFCGILLLPFAIWGLASADSRKRGFMLLTVSLVNFFAAWERKRYLPNKPPNQFTIRRLLIVMTVMAVVLTIDYLLGHSYL